MVGLLVRKLSKIRKSGVACLGFQYAMGAPTTPNKPFTRGNREHGSHERALTIKEAHINGERHTEGMNRITWHNHQPVTLLEATFAQ